MGKDKPHLNMSYHSTVSTDKSENQSNRALYSPGLTPPGLGVGHRGEYFDQMSPKSLSP